MFDQANPGTPNDVIIDQIRRQRPALVGLSFLSTALQVSSARFGMRIPPLGVLRGDFPIDPPVLGPEHWRENWTESCMKSSPTVRLASSGGRSDFRLTEIRKGGRR